MSIKHFLWVLKVVVFRTLSNNSWKECRTPYEKYFKDISPALRRVK